MPVGKDQQEATLLGGVCVAVKQSGCASVMWTATLDKPTQLGCSPVSVFSDNGYLAELLHMVGITGINEGLSATLPTSKPQ